MGMSGNMRIGNAEVSGRKSQVAGFTLIPYAFYLTPSSLIVESRL